MKEKLSKRLAQIMEELDLNQTELGKLANITPSSISDYLNERYMPKQDKIDAIARACNVSPSWLMGYDVPKHRKELQTLAAHLDGDFTPEELEEIRKFAEYIKSRRK